MTSAQRIHFIELLVQVVFACPRAYRTRHAPAIATLLTTCGVTLPELGDRRRAALPLVLYNTAHEWTLTDAMRAAWVTLTTPLPTTVRRSCQSMLAALHTSFGTAAAATNTKTYQPIYVVAIRGQGQSVVNLYEAAAICHVKPATLSWHLSRHGRFSTVLEVDTGSEDVTVTRAC